MHVDTDLSAYLDGELGPADRARVDAHLDTCDRCRARLGELRATAALVAALPSARPSRSLVPRVVERRNWLRPIRSLSAVASGAFLFVFLVTAVARSGSGLGGGTAAPFGPNAPAAAPQSTAATVREPVPAAVPAPAATAAATAAADTVRSGFSASAPPGLTAVQGTPPPKAAEAATPTPAAPRVEIQRSPQALTESARERAPGPTPLSDPLVWLGLAVIAAVAAIAAHWRLRTV